MNQKGNRMRVRKYLSVAAVAAALAVSGATAHALEDVCENGCRPAEPAPPWVAPLPDGCEDNVPCYATGEPPVPQSAMTGIAWAHRPTVWCEQARGRVINPPPYGLCSWAGDHYIWAHGTPWWERPWWL